MITAPWPASIARLTISVSVTVLPDPVAPTINVWLPLTSPSGITTPRRLASEPITIERRSTRCRGPRRQAITAATAQP
ncbi:MAG: hypothetical protein ABSH27_15240, partial [Solirubrobacteraceae bacterium]